MQLPFIIRHPLSAIDAIRHAVIGDHCEVPADLVSLFPELTAARFRRGGLPVRIGGWALGRRTADAITLWRTVFLAPGVRPTAGLLLHELRHVHQFHASRAFPVFYLWESLCRGYGNNRFEADAKAFAEARLAARPPILRNGDL